MALYNMQLPAKSLLQPLRLMQHFSYSPSAISPMPAHLEASQQIHGSKKALVRAFFACSPGATMIEYQCLMLISRLRVPVNCWQLPQCAHLQEYGWH